MSNNNLMNKSISNTLNFSFQNQKKKNFTAMGEFFLKDTFIEVTVIYSFKRIFINST